MKKTALTVLLVAAAIAGCSKTDTAPATAKAPAAKSQVAKPVMPPGSPPPAPELKFDEKGQPIIPKVVAPAPPKPPGGPSAPGLSPEALKAAQAKLAAKKAP
ncbi:MULTISPECIES: hypothetical protein [unclassified Variovorax]|uniref:hypothetical protein n=1 Tax=unclassified Variovorax TaxID=663243 RepID=UPI001319593B|nr:MULTISPECIES: hypothetical protein [unclassified Variovorax]VTU42783.1 hypothetical protein H6P1_00278 [Variovorax sp. PBL-H6]VTU43683.1 hypothetical protein SRS16P1_00626 [Variovorax sp. SRS16]VTU43746.1 hypothetical protein E5P1_00620 [Variovorax sp. PBL-E5]